MYIPPSPAGPAGPGIFLIFAKSSAKASSLPQDLVSRLSSSLPGIGSSVQYKAADEGNEKQHLLLCQVPDLSQLNSKELGNLLTERADGIEWDVRVFAEVEIYGPTHEDDKAGAAPTILTALVQPPPGGEPDLDAWYRSEHNQQMSEQPGWKRTCRYSLLSHFRIHPSSPIEISDSKDSEDQSWALRFLAIHEFGQGEQLGDTVGALEPVSEWTKKVLREAVGIEAGIWRRVDESGV